MTGFLLALFIASVHFLPGHRRATLGVQRSSRLSAAGGAAVAYVFLHLLPELSAAHARNGLEGERWFFLFALVGLAAAYGLESFARRHESDAPRGAFVLHLLGLALYNALIGHLVARRGEEETGALLLFAGAMALHLLASDFALRLERREAWNRGGRWALALAVLAGWASGAALDLPRGALDAVFAFLAGGLVLDILKEEVPEERKGNFVAFALGATAYGALLLLVD